VPLRSKTSISDLRKRPDRLGAVEGLPDVLGVAGMKLVTDCFLRETDPYGRPWKPLKYRRGRILRKTGRMYNSRTYTAGAQRVRIEITAAYSKAHQDPQDRTSSKGKTWRLPRREMVPDERGLPPAWERVLHRDTVTYLAKVSAGKRT